RGADRGKGAPRLWCEPRETASQAPHTVIDPAFPFPILLRRGDTLLRRGDTPATGAGLAGRAGALRYPARRVAELAHHVPHGFDTPRRADDGGDPRRLRRHLN